MGEEVKLKALIDSIAQTAAGPQPSPLSPPSSAPSSTNRRTNMPDLDLDKLEQVAFRMDCADANHGHCGEEIFEVRQRLRERDEAEKAFRATFDPPTVLSILEALKEARARLTEEGHAYEASLAREDDWAAVHDNTAAALHARATKAEARAETAERLLQERTRERDEAMKAIEGLARLGQLVTNAVDPGGQFHVSVLKDAVVKAEARAETAERLLAEVGGALRGIVDDAGDAFIYGRLIRGDMPEDEHRARSNDLADRIAKARQALSNLSRYLRTDDAFAGSDVSQEVK